MAILLWEVSCRAHVRSSVVITVLSTRSGTLTSTKEKQREGATSVRFSFVRGEGVRLHVVNHSFKGPLNKKCTLGAQSTRDVSSAVSGFCQVFIYSDPREMFFSRLRPTAEDVSAFGRHRKFPPQARKSSGTQGITNDALREESVNNHRCQCDWPPVSLSWSSYTLQPHKASGPVSLCL